MSAARVVDQSPEAVLDRYRMALTEIGYPADAVWLIKEPDGDFSVWSDARAISDDVLWRAREVVLADTPCCRTCFAIPERQFLGGASVGCEATLRLMDDCGRIR